MSDRAYIGAEGAVVLGGSIVCDGFVPECNVRIQTHVHSDHMAGFASSKGVGDIIASPMTHDLLIDELNADLRYRSNFRALDYNVPLDVGSGCTVVLKDAGHMAGSAQVRVVHQDGYRTGYSGDFSWPLNDVIEVDLLILDATYGSPDCVRQYSQREAEDRFVAEALKRVKTGPVFIYAHRGTLQRAIALLDDATQMPLIGSLRQIRESVMYERYGHNQATLIDPDSEAGKEAISSGRYLMFVGTGDPRRDLRIGEHKIILSAYMAPRNDPFLEYSDFCCRVAMSNHADFNETLDYVRAVNPQVVLTDASRSVHAESLASEIWEKLGIPARPAFPVTTRSWS